MNIEEKAKEYIEDRLTRLLEVSREGFMLLTQEEHAEIRQLLTAYQTMRCADELAVLASVLPRG